MELLEENYLGIKNLNLNQDGDGYGFVEYYGLNIPMAELHKALSANRKKQKDYFSENIDSYSKIDNKFEKLSNTRLNETKYNLVNQQWAIETVQEIVYDKLQHCPYMCEIYKNKDNICKIDIYKIYDICDKDIGEANPILTVDAPNNGYYLDYQELPLIKKDVFKKIDSCLNKKKSLKNENLQSLKQYLVDGCNQTLFGANLCLMVDDFAGLSKNSKMEAGKDKQYWAPKRDAVVESRDVGSVERVQGVRQSRK